MSKPGLDLLDPGQVCHEWRSGAGTKVDDQGELRAGYTQQSLGLTTDWRVEGRVGS